MGGFDQTLIINDKSGSRILVRYDDTSALSVSSPKQVPWEILENSKVVYIGEVFVEVAQSIIASTKQLQIPVIYRPSIPYLERGLDSLEPIIVQSDYLLLSNQAHRHVSSTKTVSLEEILELSNGSVVVRESKENYLLVNENGKQDIHACGSETVDITQWFVAGLLDGIASGLDYRDSFKKGLQLEREKFTLL